MRITLVLPCVALLLASPCFGDEPFASDPFGDSGRLSKPTTAAVERLEPDATPLQIRGPEAHERIERELRCKTAVSVQKMPLAEVVQAMSKAHKIPIVVEQKSLSAKSISPNTPISIGLSNVSLHAALTIRLREHGLDYVYKNAVLQVMTREDVLREPVMLSYVLDSSEDRGDDIADLLQKSLDATHVEPMPRPVVHLVRRSDTSSKTKSLYVQANRMMHDQVREILKQFQARP